MLKCIIIDDESLALDLLEDYIKSISYLQLIKRCTSSLEALELIQKTEIDLVFCDIQMPGLTGIQLIRSLVEKPMFILVTAYKSYAVEGYEIDIVDFLLKPVSYERFIKACNKALALYNLKRKDIRPVVDHIFLPVDYSMVKVILSNIIYIEALKDYIKIFMLNETKSLLVRSTMKAIEEMLPQSMFVRIHKSYIINTGMVTAIRKNSIFLGDLEFVITEPYKGAAVKITGRNL